MSIALPYHNSARCYQYRIQYSIQGAGEYVTPWKKQTKEPLPYTSLIPTRK